MTFFNVHQVKSQEESELSLASIRLCTAETTAICPKKPHVRDIITVVAKGSKYENIENFQDLLYFTSNKPKKNENCKPKQKLLNHFTSKWWLLFAFTFYQLQHETKTQENKPCFGGETRKKKSMAHRGYHRQERI